MISHTDISYTVTAHPMQKLDLHLPEQENFPVFIYFHGGGLESGSKEVSFIPDLVAKGIAVASVNYRMYPEAVFPEFLQDAAASAAWVKKNINSYGNCTDIFVGGSSAGGYLTQMLCFDTKYLKAHHINADELSGYYMDAGQPTTHFNVLRERGIDSRKVIIDEAAPLYYIEEGRNFPPIEIVVSDHDMENRYEQTILLMSTLKHFRYNMEQIHLTKMENSTHCQYISQKNEDGTSKFADMIYEFISRVINNRGKKQ